MKGRFRFSNVVSNMTNNYIFYKEHPDEYFNEVRAAINNGLVSYSYFRWHAAGDIVDEQYLINMVKVAKDLPNTSFLAFTKKYELINEYIKTHGDFPQNLHIILSAWGNYLPFENPYNLPVAYVRFADTEQNTSIPESALECAGNCTECLQCWNIKRGESVVFNKH